MKARKVETAALKAEAAAVEALLRFAASRLDRLHQRAGRIHGREDVDGYTVASWVEGCTENALMGMHEAVRMTAGLGKLTPARLRKEISDPREAARVIA